MSSQSALYRQKNQDTLQLIKNLSEAEEELTRKLAYTNNKKNRQNLENSIRTISETKENLVTALGSLSKYYTSNFFLSSTFSYFFGLASSFSYFLFL